MTTVTIRGASDDLIEIEGDIEEEFTHCNEDPAYLAFSDGTLLSIRYGEDGGFWRINTIYRGSATMEKVEATNDEGKDYSDRVALTGDIRWVVCGDSYAPRGR